MLKLDLFFRQQILGFIIILGTFWFPTHTKLAYDTVTLLKVFLICWNYYKKSLLLPVETCLHKKEL